MPSTKVRGRHVELRYHRVPDPNAISRWLATGDPTGLIRPTALPPDVPAKQYRQEHARLVTAVGHLLHDLRAASVNCKVDTLRRAGYSEDAIAIQLKITKTRVHRILVHLSALARRNKALRKRYRRSGSQLHQ